MDNPQAFHKIEQSVLDQYSALRDLASPHQQLVLRHELERQVLDDLSYFSSQAVSDITGSSEHEKFYIKWESVIKSGMHEDLTRLNPMAHWMMAKEDAGLLTVNRLQRELACIRNTLPRREIRAQPATVRTRASSRGAVAQALSGQQKLLSDIKFLLN